MQLSNKIFLVTGATGGLGRCIANEIEARGGFVLRTSGGECDIAEAEDRAVITQLVVDHGGQLVGALNNLDLMNAKVI